jgi:tellurium resistance protein TerD
VPSDEWFIFYGQPESPDGAVRFSEDGREDREVISLDLGRLSPVIQRIVFVMTINEAVEHRLNFGMIQEVWMRITDSAGRELVGYSPSELFDNVTSMTLGELYLRNGEWRFNPVGNGVNADLAGQCAAYGVEIDG